jgi:hypothetical protein
MKQLIENNTFLMSNRNGKIAEQSWSVNFYNVAAGSTDIKDVDKDFIQDLSQWKSHDWKNIIAFKDLAAWNRFMDAMGSLAQFYTVMHPKNEAEFNIFGKFYTSENIEQAKNDFPSASWFVCDYLPEIVDLINQGYVVVYFTTQRECHDKNQSLTIIFDNYLYFSVEIGHIWDMNAGIAETGIKPILINEKY